MSALTDEMKAIIRSETERKINDVEKAITESVKKIQCCVGYNTWVDELVESAVRVMVQSEVYDIRHKSNVELRRGEFYGGPPKVNVGTSPSVKQVYRDYLSYQIAGRTLGALLGEELAPLAMRERNTSKTHELLASVLERLSKIVPSKKQVKEVVDARRMARIWKSMETKLGINVVDV